MYRVIVFILLFPLVVSFTGCATIIGGTSQNVSVSSNPTGATVNIDGQSSYTTPTTVRLERKRDHVLVFTKEGYLQQNVILLHVISGAVCGNILLGGLIGWGVDALTGAQFKLVPEHVNVELQKASSETAAAVPIKELTAEDKVNELKNMYDKGLITKEEYEANKKVILMKMSQKGK